MTFLQRIPLTCLLVAILATSACSSMPKNVFRLSETNLETRELQTRQFDEVTENQLMSASVGLLQDLGYSIDELDKNLGVISASKLADARNDGQIAGRVTLDVLGCVATYLLRCNNKNYKKTDKVQDIRLTLVVLPQVTNNAKYSVRITMQRIVWDRANRISRQATITDAEVYQGFFVKLDRSVFLEREGS